MARTVRDAKLESRTARAKLAPGQRHWRALDPGLHIGYRRGTTGGKWQARFYTGDGAYNLETIGTADDKADADGEEILNFAQAQAAVRARHIARSKAARGIPAGPYTVARCLEEYLQFMERDRKSAKDSRWRAEAYIIPELGDIACDDLSSERVRDWLHAAAQQPARVRSKQGAVQRYRKHDATDPEQRRQRRATTNRLLAILRAALNQAWREGKIESDVAWRRVSPFKEVDAARGRYLTNDECRRLINTAQDEFRDLVRAALLTGARFGELAALQVRDFSPDTGRVHVRVSKSGKSRDVVLHDEGITLFKRLAAGRPGTEFMLRRPNGSQWGPSSYDWDLKAASRRAGIRPAINFHCLRHTYASLSIMGGAPLLVVAKNLGHSDTRMVEKHYGHLAESYVADEIRKAAPRFGTEADSKVVPLS
jgi:integrase